MMSMFYEATSFNGDVSAWDVSKVTAMWLMFKGATAFNGDVSAWDVSQVTTMSSMFYEVTLPTATYDAMLNAWSALPVQSGVPFHGGDSKFSASGKAARDALFTSHGWSIDDFCGGSGTATAACGP
eukprot:TRINITY_DN160_c0_g1_i7.p1 TRINITY_DN160_c0_g1~~TRINITY_DN160_c0_g1_i7.p1  ORF type:complete len:126 (-),score=42.30 TRINITY_DN160_c0_g1_i7:74-451(-)